MATFRVGQRVRVNWPGIASHGKEGVVWEIVPKAIWRPSTIEAGRVSPDDTAYRVDLEGVGKQWKDGVYVAFAEHQLEPIVESDGFQSFMDKVLTPIDKKLLPPLSGDVPRMPRRKPAHHRTT